MNPVGSLLHHGGIDHGAEGIDPRAQGCEILADHAASGVIEIGPAEGDDMEVQPDIGLFGPGGLRQFRHHGCDQGAPPVQPWLAGLGQDPCGSGGSALQASGQGNGLGLLEGRQAVLAETGRGQGVEVGIWVFHLPEDEVPDEIEADAIGLELPQDPADFLDPLLPVGRTRWAHEFDPVILGSLTIALDCPQPRIAGEGLWVVEDGKDHLCLELFRPRIPEKSRILCKIAADPDRVQSKGLPGPEGRGAVLLGFVDFDASNGCRDRGLSPQGAVPRAEDQDESGCAHGRFREGARV